MSWAPGLIIIILNRFTTPALCFEARPLTRPIEGEIVSPYHGILINTDLGNPIVPLA